MTLTHLRLPEIEIAGTPAEFLELLRAMRTESFGDEPLPARALEEGRIGEPVSAGGHSAEWKPEQLAPPVAAPAAPPTRRRCPPHHYVYASPIDDPYDEVVGICKECGGRKKAWNVKELALTPDAARRRASNQPQQKSKHGPCSVCREYGHNRRTCTSVAQEAA